ncbi:hypothetical protein CEQ15_03865 [Chryseobacterium indologenes]|uniref:hypothetical protein n=1 Tax=Chryseobacterium indologenes TaxID=253 RepID=UPI000B516EB0|nr:hypothetical protein [Chryseobacterium indologenes]ASE60701.1 hypothetical protein CEQ15_03865 [Chryseobacterium indologenes]
MAALFLFSSCSKDDDVAPDEGLLPVPNPDTTRVYKDGEYTARGVYGGAPSYITVDVKLQNGIIMKVLVTPMPVNNETSRGFQERFATAVPTVVEGKHISEVKVGKLAGSSGTNIGFNNAIDMIKEQAAE